MAVQHRLLAKTERARLSRTIPPDRAIFNRGVGGFRGYRALDDPAVEGAKRETGQRIRLHPDRDEDGAILLDPAIGALDLAFDAHRGHLLLGVGASRAGTNRHSAAATGATSADPCAACTGRPSSRANCGPYNNERGPLDHLVDRDQKPVGPLLAVGSARSSAAMVTVAEFVEPALPIGHQPFGLPAAAAAGRLPSSTLRSTRHRRGRRLAIAPRLSNPAIALIDLRRRNRGFNQAYSTRRARLARQAGAGHP